MLCILFNTDDDMGASVNECYVTNFNTPASPMVTESRFGLKS